MAYSFVSVAFHPVNAYLLSSSFDGTCRLWNTKDFTQPPKILVDETASTPYKVHSCVFSKGGTFLVVAGSDSLARVWDVSTQTLVETLRGALLASVSHLCWTQRVLLEQVINWI